VAFTIQTKKQHTVTFDVYSPNCELPTIYPDQLHKLQEKGATAYMMQIYSLQLPVQEQILPVIA
jgi:hypothetical protein